MINEYKSIVSQMFDDLSTNSVVATNYELVWCGNHNATTNLCVANVGAWAINFWKGLLQLTNEIFQIYLKNIFK
jgi:carbohydrate-binding DOMON domain-containing protein